MNFPLYRPPPEEADPREVIREDNDQKLVEQRYHWSIIVLIAGLGSMGCAVVLFILAVILLSWQPAVISFVLFVIGNICLKIGLSVPETSSTERG